MLYSSVNSVTDAGVCVTVTQVPLTASEQASSSMLWLSDLEEEKATVQVPNR